MQLERISIDNKSIQSMLIHATSTEQMMVTLTKLIPITLLPGVPGSESMAEGDVGCSDMM